MRWVLLGSGGLGDSLASGAKGPAFESRRAHHIASDPFASVGFCALTRPLEVEGSALREIGFLPVVPMSLSPGARLGPYEILSPLGAGGMGEVYRARDTRLRREVAIKTLPESFAADPERIARFEREARLLAVLNHPNIAAIYGIEESEGSRLLVLELVEGETLAERLAAGPLTLEDALAVCVQIASGLEAAHEAGVIHRDLKPANVKIRPDGSVKILDLGLARGVESPAVATDPSLSPTVTTPATGAGVILGTAAYMSPEQARGRPLDKRADVFSFGCVLYECLTAKRAFLGETVSDTLAAVLMKEPDWSALPETVPGTVRTLLHDCLVRDPKQRLHDIGDARLAIERIGSGTMESAAAAVAVPPAWRRALPWALVALGVAAGALWAPFRHRAAPAPPLRLSVGLGADVSLDLRGVTGAGPAAILSPDGSLLAFVARKKEDERPQLFLRRLDQLQAAPLPGTDGARSPFFSPDGQWIAFFADGRLKRIAVSGGAPVVLADAPNDRGGSWSEDGTILFAPNSMTSVGLSRVSSSGGPTEVLTRPDLTAGEVTHRWPQALPGGEAVLFTAHRTLGSYDDASIVVQRLPSGPRKVVVTGGYHGRYLSSGHLVYVHEGTLFAVPFDLARLEAAGAAVPVIEELVGGPRTAAAQFAFSNRGTLVYLPGRTIEGKLSIQWLDRTGKLSPLRGVPGPNRGLRFSPDGTKLAVQVFDGKNSDIWTYDWGRDTMSRLTFDVVGLTTPVWSPAGRGVAFASYGGSQLGHIYWQRADGTGTPQALTESKTFQNATSWHPGGRYLAFEELSPETGYDVMILPIDGDEASGLKPRRPTPFLNGPFNESDAAFSPDGRWLAYSSNESGRVEVYVRPFPGPGGKWQISTGGGFYPTWSRNGRELFYETPEETLMVAPYSEQSGSFLADKPRLWCETRIPTQQGIRGFDLHPDGRRFAVLQEVVEPSQAKRDHVVLFLNFVDELRRLAPSK